MDNNIITTKLKGGLGNFLFQIATAFNYSKKYNKKLVLNVNDVYVVHNNINHYQDNIFSKLEFVNHAPFFEKKYTETLFEYNEIPYFEGSLYIDGYFQSEKYFSSIRNEILGLFDFGEKTKNKVTKKYSEYLDKNTCSIHFRRGNYLKLQDSHPTLPIEYYQKSINEFDNETIFFIFSDDMEWCKNNLSSLSSNMVFVEDNLDFEDLYLMSLCKNNIICNSTFSWWGAWLNKNDNKKVISPSTWFGPSNKHLNTKDIYCENWCVI